MTIIERIFFVKIDNFFYKPKPKIGCLLLTCRLFTSSKVYLALIHEFSNYLFFIFLVKIDDFFVNQNQYWKLIQFIYFSNSESQIKYVNGVILK